MENPRVDLRAQPKGQPKEKCYWLFRSSITTVKQASAEILLEEAGLEIISSIDWSVIDSISDGRHGNTW